MQLGLCAPSTATGVALHRVELLAHAAAFQLRRGGAQAGGGQENGQAGRQRNKMIFHVGSMAMIIKRINEGF